MLAWNMPHMRLGTHHRAEGLGDARSPLTGPEGAAGDAVGCLSTTAPLAGPRAAWRNLGSGREGCPVVCHLLGTAWQAGEAASGQDAASLTGSCVHLCVLVALMGHPFLCQVHSTWIIVAL